MSEYKDYYETICTISPVGLFRTDVDGNIVYVNKKYEELTGKNREELEKDGWITTIHSRDIQKVYAEWNACIKEERKFVLEYRIKRYDKTIWVLGQAIPINGGGKGFVGTITNINKRKKILDELILMREGM